MIPVAEQYVAINSRIERSSLSSHNLRRFLMFHTRDLSSNAGGMVVIASRMFLGEAFGHLSGIDTVNVVVELAEEILQPGLKLPPVAFPCDGMTRHLCVLSQNYFDSHTVTIHSLVKSFQ